MSLSTKIKKGRISGLPKNMYFCQSSNSLITLSLPFGVIIC